MRTQRSIWTFLTQEMYTGLAVLVSLLTTPLLLRWVNDQRFGAFQAMMGVIAYLVLLEFGMSDALSPMLAGAFGRGDRVLMRRTLSAGVRAYARVAMVSLAVSVGLLFLMPRLIHVSPRYVQDLRNAWLICIAGIPFLLLAPFRVLVHAQQRGYWLNLAYITQWAIITVLSLVLAWAGWGITGQSLAFLFGALFLYLILTAYALKRFPGVLSWRSIRGPADPAVASRLFDLRTPSFVLNVCNTVSLLSDNLVIAYLISPAAVVPFFVTQKAALLLGKELQGIGGSSWPALAELHAQDEVRVFNARLIDLTRLVSILAVAGVVPIFVYNQYFVACWVGASRYAGDWFTIVAGVNALFTACFALWTLAITGTGHVRDMLGGMLAQAVINVVGSICFTLAFGVMGPILGTCTAFLAVSIWYLPAMMARLFKTRVWDLFLSLLQPVALGVPYLFAAWLFGTTYGAADWFSLMWQTPLLAGGYLLTAWMILLSKAERAQWTERVRLAIPRVAY